MLLGVYVLLVGLMAGLLFGPMVLGRFQPDTYQRWMPNPQALAYKKQAIARSRKALEMTDVTYVALTEYDQQRQPESDAIETGLSQAKFMQGIMRELILAAVCCLVVMNLTNRNRRLFDSLHLMAHLCLGIWLCLFVAQPYLLVTMPRTVVLVMVVLTVLICLIQSRKSGNDTTAPAESDVAR